MTETPPCPYCGAETRLNENNEGIYWYECRECNATGPTEKTPVEAFSAALHRAEPGMRPLTLEEAQKQSKNKNVVWLEMPGKPYAEVAYVTPTDKLSSICFVYILSSTLTMHSKKYGKLWRCWPRKPTPEQMAAAKWEE